MSEKSTWEKIVDAIAKNVALFFVVLGTAFVLLGANAGFEKWGLGIDSPYWRIVLAAVGLILAGFGVRLIWRGGRNRQFCNCKRV
jgi:hypothetical protein